MFKINLYQAFILLFLALGLIPLSGNNKAENEPSLISERVILNTDRRVYIAGENLLFSFYLIDNHANSLATYPSIGYVILRNSEGEILGKSQVKIKEGKASGAIFLSDTLHSGYYQIVAYTNFMRNGSPEIYYKSQVLIANRFDRDFFDIINRQSGDSISVNGVVNEKPYIKPFNIVPYKTSFNKREKAGFKINIVSAGIKFSDLTISVIEKNKIEEQFSKNIQKSVRNSKAIVVNKNNALHLAEDRYGELLGKLTDSNSGDAVGYHVLYLSSPDTIANFEYAVTDAEGYFRFPLADYYSGKDLFIKVKQNDNESLNPKIIIDSKFDYTDEYSPDPWPIDSSILSYLKNSQNIIRIQKSFSLIKSQYQSTKFTNNIPLLYKIPDYSIFPSEFAELKDFVEISREIIPTLKIRKHNIDYTAEILDVKQKKYLPNPPMIFLDGVLIDDINQVMSLGTKDIRKIDVISSPWIVDHQELDGVISLYTYRSLWRNVSLNNYNLQFKSESYYELPQLYNPNYSIISKESREPDFRQLLYWNPNFHLNSDNSGAIEFYTSDYATSYLIKISGISDKGEKIEAYSEFEVK